MLKHVELDPTFALHQEFADPSTEPTILLNVFDVDPSDQEPFKGAWVVDAEFFSDQPGCIHSQLHQGIGTSRMFLNYAVFENTAAFAATTRQPQFEPLRRIYPDSATAHPHLFRRLNVPGICVGDTTAAPATPTRGAPTSGLSRDDLDPSTPITAQLSDQTGKKPTIQITIYEVDHDDRGAFVAAWTTQARTLADQPGCLSQQLHSGLLESRLFMSYTTWERTSALADALAEGDTANINAAYPDNVTARSHLFRRLHVPGICIGEADGSEHLPADRRMMPAQR